MSSILIECYNKWIKTTTGWFVNPTCNVVVDNSSKKNKTVGLGMLALA